MCYQAWTLVRAFLCAVAPINGWIAKPVNKLTGNEYLGVKAAGGGEGLRGGKIAGC